MWIIADYLRDLHPKLEITSGRCVIDSVCVFSYEDDITPENLYIGLASDFFGGDSTQVILVNSDDIIIIENAEMANVLNRIIHIFTTFRKWEERLQSAMHSSAPYQSVLDVAHEMFHCPMFFGSKNMRIFAITRQYTRDQVYDEWDDVVELMTMPVSLLRRVLQYNLADRYPENVDMAVMPTTFEMEHYHYRNTIRCNCYLHGTLWGHLFLYSYEETVRNSTLQLVQYVCEVFSGIVAAHQGNPEAQYTQYSALVDLLNGKPTNQKALQTLYWQYGWEPEDPLLLMKIAAPATGNSRVIYSWLCDNIKNVTDSSIVFPYNQCIIVIIRDRDATRSAALSGISRLIDTSEYRCGIGYPFVGMQNMKAHYHQASHALRQSSDPQRKILYFSDDPFTGMAKEFREISNWKQWLPPALLEMREYDRVHGTDYFITLYHFLMNDGHLGVTSKALFIHRNTLIYRIEKIEQMLQAQLRSPGYSIYLRFCFAMLDIEEIQKQPSRPQENLP